MEQITNLDFFASKSNAVDLYTKDQIYEKDCNMTWETWTDLYTKLYGNLKLSIHEKENDLTPGISYVHHSDWAFKFYHIMVLSNLDVIFYGIKCAEFI